ncbi:hypothetical protein [Rhizobium sp. GN54]|uniref:hypothetical protein n=1 Tax=Rhizobium sp. GN54 TaxID=2898150 RepID=UPI001E3D0399|nr:hypothetical protein [Rhizobium sp. GN54]MCD2181452.1 hypothetical protein [Rhizobium sp. GN54]
MASDHAPTPLSTRTVFAKAVMDAAEKARRRRARRSVAHSFRNPGRAGTRLRLGIALALIAAGIGWLILFG